MNLDDVMSRFDKAQRAGAGYSARCPAHEDRKASLTITPSTDKVLLHCHAGCSTDDVLRAAGLTFADLFERSTSNGQVKAAMPSGGTPNRQEAPTSGVTLSLPLKWWADYCGVPESFIASLPLHHESGSIAFEFDGNVEKRRKAGAKAFVWQPPGVSTPVLWPVPPAALPSTIWIFEGESDATVARYAGLEAYAVTKGAEGALSIPQVLALKQRGASEAVICFDADDAGRKGAAKLAEAIGQAGLTVKVLDLAAGGIVDPLAGQKDLRDAWRALRDRDELRRRLEAAANASRQAGFPDSRSLIHREVGKGCSAAIIETWRQPEPPPRRWIVPGLIVEGALNVWYGDAGVFKSWLATALAVSLTAGTAFLGCPLAAGTVLYVDSELDAEEFTRRAYRMARGSGLSTPPTNLYYYRLPGSLQDPDVAATVRDLAQAIGADLVILDSLSLAAFGADLSAADATTAVLHNVLEWGTVLALDHTAKPMPGVNLSGYRPYGSQFKWAQGRCITQILKADSGKGVILRPAKSNFGPLESPKGATILFDGDQVSVSAADLAAEELAGVEDNLPALERTYRALLDGSATAQELADATGVKPKTISNHLSTLAQQDRAERLGDGRWQAKSRQAIFPDSPITKGSGIGKGCPPASEDEPAAAPTGRQRLQFDKATVQEWLDGHPGHSRQEAMEALARDGHKLGYSIDGVDDPAGEVF